MKRWVVKVWAFLARVLEWVLVPFTKMGNKKGKRQGFVLLFFVVVVDVLDGEWRGEQM